MECPECQSEIHLDSQGHSACIKCGYSYPSVKNLDSFTKFDTDKPMLSLVESNYIIGTAEVLTFGAKKYDVDNWKKATAEDIQRYKDSLLRHVYAYLGGEMDDPETGLSHLYHASCNLMFLDYFSKQE